MATKPAIDKRKLILDSAIKVFAKKGYHRSRVSDIAKEAGIAYGLVYHYFKNKEEVLNSIFRERWGAFLDAIRLYHESPLSIREKFTNICFYLVNSYNLRPDLMEVLVLEIARSSKFLQESHLEKFEGAFSLIEAIIRDGQSGGEFRPDVDPKLAAYVFLGAIDLILTGYVLGTLKARDVRSYQRVAETVVDVFLQGLGTG
jgi:TetR/AcrR family fatty acid metabolism transcriptional regulator